MERFPRLMEAARTGNIDGLYKAIKKNPTVLKEIDEIQFVNTPLHAAASAGQTEFALDTIRLAPSFGRKLNPESLSPLDLAVLNNHYDTVKRLVSVDSELIRVKGKEKQTPLHRAAASDDKIPCLIEFLLACPDSIEDLTIHDETALHIAMKNSSVEAFKILYEWVRRAGDKQLQQLLQKKDADGNSAETYHKKRQPRQLQGVKTEIPSSLCTDDDNTRNVYRYLRTPEMTYERRVRIGLQRMVRIRRGLTMEMRDVVLVVVVLIASASFQAIFTIFSLPVGNSGGLEYHSNNSSAQHHDSNFDFTVFSKWFILLNAVAFTFSVYAIAIVIPVRPYTWMVHLSLIFMEACYWSFLNWVLTPVVAFKYCIISFVFTFLIYYFKILFLFIESHKPELLALWLFMPCSTLNFRCLHLMGALTFKRTVHRW